MDLPLREDDIWYMFLPTFGAIWYVLWKHQKQGNKLDFWKLRVLLWIPVAIMFFLIFLRKWRFG